MLLTAWQRKIQPFITWKTHSNVEKKGITMLENKLGITNSQELASQEEKISKEKAVYLWESGLLETLTPGTFETLSTIHRILFETIYDFAGQLRQVNMAKGNFRFAPVLYLDQAVSRIEKMPQSTFLEIVSKYVEMNVAHPFREGNGRSSRIWLDLMLKQSLARVVDWSQIDKEDYLLAMERSPIRDTEIKTLLEGALTDQIDSREMYMKGIDHSYYYEGYATYPLYQENTKP